MDFSGLDLSGMDFSGLDMSGLDLSEHRPVCPERAIGHAVGHVLRPVLPRPRELEQGPAQLANVDFQTIIRSALADGAVKDGAADYLSAQASQIAQGFQDYAREQIEAGGTTDFATLASAYFSQPEVLEQLRAAVSSDQVVDSDKLAANLTKALGDDPALAQSRYRCLHSGS